MEPWFTVKKKDVIAVLKKSKGCAPWGGSADEKYACLVFWDDGAVYMTVNQFREVDADTYECLRFYTDYIGRTLEDYTNLTEEKLASAAYRAWCSGAR